MEKDGVHTIDLSDFPKQNERLRKACEEWGCFRIINHNIPLALLSEMKEVARSLLDLPTEVKTKNTNNYMPPRPKSPLMEALYISDSNSASSANDFCSKFDASSHQRDVIVKYIRATYEVAVELARKMAESMGVSSADDLFEGWPSVISINKYNFSSETIGCNGADTHSDSAFITILQTDEDVGCLEVMDKSGEYVAVDLEPGTLLVNLGDFAKAWSNGRVCNVKHRVKCKQATGRVSIASFLTGPNDRAMEAPQELVDHQHPRLYVPFIFKDYRELRLKNNFLSGEALELLRIKS